MSNCLTNVLRAALGMHELFRVQLRGLHASPVHCFLSRLKGHLYVQ